MTKKIECEIVQDLLPSYIEGLTHEVTTKAVDEHLEDCLVCEEVYEMMKEPEPKVIEEESKRLSRFLKKTKTRSLIIGLGIALLICSAFWGYRKMFVESVVVLAEDIVIEDLAMRTDGTVQFRFTDVHGYQLTWMDGGRDYEDKSVFVYQVGRPFLGKPSDSDNSNMIETTIHYMGIEGISKIVYRDERGKELVIWEEGMELPIVEVQ